MNTLVCLRAKCLTVPVLNRGLTSSITLQERASFASLCLSRVLPSKATWARHCSPSRLISSQQKWCRLLPHHLRKHKVFLIPIQMGPLMLFRLTSLRMSSLSLVQVGPSVKSTQTHVPRQDVCPWLWESTTNYLSTAEAIDCPRMDGPPDIPLTDGCLCGDSLSEEPSGVLPTLGPLANLLPGDSQYFPSGRDLPDLFLRGKRPPHSEG